MKTIITEEKIYEAIRRFQDHKRDCRDCRGELSFWIGRPDLVVRVGLVLCDTGKAIILEVFNE